MSTETPAPDHPQIVEWVAPPAVHRVGRGRWSLWWRWVAVTVLGELAVAIVFSVIFSSGEGRPGNPIPIAGAIARATSTLVIVAALQSWLLSGYVGRSGLWVAIAIVEAAALGLLFVAIRGTQEVPLQSVFEHSITNYIWSTGVAAAVATAQWWFVLRVDVPRSVVWVPIMVLAGAATTAVTDAFAAAGLLGAAVLGLRLIVPIVGASTMVYMLKGKIEAGRPPVVADPAGPIGVS